MLQYELQRLSKYKKSIAICLKLRNMKDFLTCRCFFADHDLILLACIIINLTSQEN